MGRFQAPELVVPVALVTNFAVAAVVLVNVFGFIIATYHFGKVGASPGVVPLMRMWGAGLSFAVLTSVFIHVGFATMKLGDSTRRVEATLYWGVAFALIILISAFLIRYAGLVTYCGGCILVGGLAAKGVVRFPAYLPRVTAESVAIPWPALALLALLGLLWAYAVLAYPNLAGSLGGSAPQPVRVVLQDDYRSAIPPGSRAYQALVTADAYYFEVQLPEGAPKSERVDMFLFRKHDPAATYVQVPRSAVKYVEYTDTFRRAPVVEQTGSAASPPATQRAVPEPAPSAPSAAGGMPAGEPGEPAEPK